MMLKKFDRIRGYRIFQDFDWPADLHPLKSKNVFYGWNGCGKSTLSTICQHLQNRMDLNEGELKITFDDISISGNQISTAQGLPEIRVFNRDFISRNVFTENESISPIVFLGAQNIEREQHYRSLLTARDQLTANAKSEQLNAGNIERLYDNFLTDAANKHIKPLLRSSGRNPYNNYNKRSLEDALVAHSKFDEAKRQNLVVDAVHFERLKTLMSGQVLPAVAEPRSPYPEGLELVANAMELCGRKITARTIDRLRSIPEIDEWVGAGLKLHKDYELSNCEFCDQKLPPDRLAHLEMHFNAEFEKLQADSKGLLRKFDDILSLRSEDFYPPTVAIYPELQEEYAARVNELKFRIDELKDYLRSVRARVEYKSKSPFQEVMLNGFEFKEPEEILSKIREIVSLHNSKSANFEAQVMDARQRLERSIVAGYFDQFKQFEFERDNTKRNIEATKKALESIENEIEEIENEILDHSRPATELNADLRAYLGREEISFELSGSGYRLLRHGKPASHLSEGERTAIAFLYFLTSLRSRDFDLANGVVVIDDPVSSLDSNALFHAFSFMKERTNSAGQLIILTHNHAFFSLIKNWFKNLRNQRSGDQERRPASLFMLRAYMNGSIGQRQSRIEEIDPFLWLYDSEYHYLFKRVWLAANDLDEARLETLYNLPNIARRLLEAFLAFRVPDRTGELRLQLEQVDCDPVLKARLLRFLHTYSHNAAIDSEADFSGLAEASSALRDLLMLMKSEDERHFDKMISMMTA